MPLHFLQDKILKRVQIKYMRHIELDFRRARCYTAAHLMENASTTHIDLSTLDIAAMQSRLSELGSYL